MGAKRRNRFLRSLILAAGMCCLLTGLGSATVVHAAQTDTRTDTADRYKAEEYLSAYYGVEPGQVMTLQTVNGMIEALGGRKIEGEVLSDGAVLMAGLQLAGLDELAQSYLNEAAPDKADRVLGESGITTEDGYAPYVACAMDLELYRKDRPFDIKSFLYRCLEISGRGRRYIGRVSDDDLMEALRSRLDGMIVFDNDELSEVGTALLLQGTVTGFGLKYSGYDAHFLDAYTLRYSHSDYRHAIQLVGLLCSEGIDAYIQAEPKISVYEYRPMWGTPAVPSPTLMIRLTEGDRCLCYSVEYDLMIEFDTAEDRERFHGLIEAYAKKYDDRVGLSGNVTAKLLAGSWWQPLYSSATPMQNGEYQVMIDNVIYDKTGMYSLHTFTLPEDAPAVAEVVARTAPELKTSAVEIHVNPAFVRYVTGEDHQ